MVCHDWAGLAQWVGVIALGNLNALSYNLPLAEGFEQIIGQ